MAFTREFFKKRSFKIIDIPDFDTGGEKISLRALTSKEQEAIEKFQPKEDENVSEEAKSAAFKKTMLAMFAMLLGDESGNRIYTDLSEDTLSEINDNVALFVVLRVVKLGQEYNSEQLKKV